MTFVPFSDNHYSIYCELETWDEEDFHSPKLHLKIYLKHFHILLGNFHIRKEAPYRIMNLKQELALTTGANFTTFCL